MDCREAIDGRRSIRKYTPGEIPRADIERMLESAMKAPSARNSRPWSFVVVTDDSVRKKLGNLSPNFSMVLEASVAIIICGRNDLSEFWQQDCGAAIENLLLEAHSMGYGTCWCGVYPSEQRVEAVGKTIGNTDGIPMALIALGIPAESPACRGKYEQSKVKFI